MEFAIAVAAAAYAIASMEKESMNQNNTVEQLMQPTAKTTSKREDSIDKTPDYIRLTRWFTGKEAREDERESVFRFEKEISNSLEWKNAKKLKAKRRLEHKEVYDYSLINLILD
ncbi:hypothetical protein GW17_00047464 [Ensete ventricosum]|nr:hypothetical protein GW17_00047464 [Ensete ventricosum]